MPTELTLTCHTKGCTNTYTTTTRRVAHYCPRCREVRQRRKQALIREARNEAVNRARDQVADKSAFDAVVRKLSASELDKLMGMRTEGSWVVRLPDYITSENVSADDPLCLTPERQPAGTHTNLGPLDERKSYSTQLAPVRQALEYRERLLTGSLCTGNHSDGDCFECATAAEASEWFDNNPHWMVDLGEPLPEEIDERECQDRQGTRAGYLRHKRAGEAACPECSKANAEYTASRRASL